MIFLIGRKQINSSSPVAVDDSLDFTKSFFEYSPEVEENKVFSDLRDTVFGYLLFGTWPKNEIDRSISFYRDECKTRYSWGTKRITFDEAFTKFKYEYKKCFAVLVNRITGVSKVIQMFEHAVLTKESLYVLVSADYINCLIGILRECNKKSMQVFNSYPINYSCKYSATVIKSLLPKLFCCGSPYIADKDFRKQFQIPDSYQSTRLDDLCDRIGDDIKNKTPYHFSYSVYNQSILFSLSNENLKWKGFIDEYFDIRKWNR